MIGTYNSWLVFLSIIVATFASYVALDLASRVVATRGTRTSSFWLYGGGLSMGTGIWSMHFIGMLAFQLSIPMSYDIPITLSSLLIAIIVSGFALYTISHSRVQAFFQCRKKYWFEYLSDLPKPPDPMNVDL